MTYSRKSALDRYLSPADAWAMAFGCAIGWGAFVMPGTAFLPAAGPIGTVIALLAGMAVIMMIGISFSYLMRRSTGTGGVYSYAKDAFGRDHAFLCSWFLCLSYLTVVFLNGSALFLVIRTVFGDRLQTGIHYSVAGNAIDLGEAAVSAAALIAIGIMFLAAKPVLQKLHTFLAVVLGCGVLITSAVCLPHAFSSDALMQFGTMDVNPLYAVGSLVILAPWAFVGFEVISFDTAHFSFPVKKTGRIIMSSILAAGCVYIFMTLASISAVPAEYVSWQEYISHLDELSGVASVPAFYAADTLMPKAGLAVMTVTALAAILTGIIGGYRAALRVLSTMAEDRILSEKFSETSYSILFIMVLSVLISLLGRNTLSWFVDLTSFGAVAAYGYTAAAAYKLANAENRKGIAGVSLAGTVIAALFAVVQLVPDLTVLDAMSSQAFLLLSLWCLLGFVFYLRTVRQSDMADFSGMSVSGTVLFSLLMYSALMWAGKTIALRQSTAEIHKFLFTGGVLLLAIIFTGFSVMLYIQNLVRKKHEENEREKIRAVEGSLAKSRFLFNMSHDIRTPMNAIIGYTNLALNEEKPDVLHDYLEKISMSSHHLLALINDILEMSRIESGKAELEMVPTDLHQVFAGINDLFAEQMKQKQMNFSVHYSRAQDRYVWCDRNNLNRILLNLVSNAYKFTPEEGTITVTLSETAGTSGEYGNYEIRVQDNGIGMSKDFAEKMFHAFERERTSTDSGIEGTGLGLAITKGIVDLMGGTIEVLTSPGSGTQMIIRLKMRLAEQKDVLPQEQISSADSQKKTDFTGKRLLLAEDNMINMEIAVMILKQLGFEIETAENGKIALEKVIEAEPEYYDAVLMDIQMPVMDGYAAAKAIRQLSDRRKAELPVIAMTANAFKEDEEAALEAGMNAHIAKPVDVEKLKQTLSEVFREKENFS